MLITAGLLSMLTANMPAARALLIEARELGAQLLEPQLEGYATFFHGLTDDAARTQFEIEMLVAGDLNGSVR